MVLPVNRRRFVVAAGALVVAPSALARRLGGAPVALVTADLESHVVAVEISTGRVLRRIETRPGPRSIESSLATIAVVAHTEYGALTLLDGRSLRVVSVLEGVTEPRYTAADRTGRYAYVSDSKRGEVVVLDLPRRKIVGRVALDGPARHLSLAPNGRALWVSLGTKAKRIAVVGLDAPARPRLATTIAPPFLAHDVGFAPDGSTVWVTSGDRGSLALYDARTHRLRRRLDADAAPQHVTFIGGRAYVTSGDNGSLRVHATGGQLLHTASVPRGSYNVQQGFGEILTPSLETGTLCIASRAGRVLRTKRVARSSHDACFVMAA